MPSPHGSEGGGGGVGVPEHRVPGPLLPPALGHRPAASPDDGGSARWMRRSVVREGGEGDTWEVHPSKLRQVWSGRPGQAWHPVHMHSSPCGLIGGGVSGARL